jgi:hypothetical protein
MTVNTALSDPEKNYSTGSLLLGTGLALASFIILPAVATRLGLGPSLTGAMRIALMKASARASRGTTELYSPRLHAR